MTLVDIGSGDGLIAFGAIDRVGDSLRVILTDVSRPLLRFCENQAAMRGASAQCRLLEGSAERLEGIDEASADVVTSRAVLAYVADKPRAFGELYRVLKPGGRISIAEPVMQDQALETVALTNALAARGEPADPSDFMHLMQRWRAAQYPSTEAAMRASPATGYNERDLLRWARAAGFGDVHVELHIDARPSAVNDWALFLSIAPYPGVPTLGEILAEQFSIDERRRFEDVMRPLIEAGRWTTVDLIAYLVAIKSA